MAFTDHGVDAAGHQQADGIGNFLFFLLAVGIFDGKQAARLGNDEFLNQLLRYVQIQIDAHFLHHIGEGFEIGLAQAVEAELTAAVNMPLRGLELEALDAEQRVVGKQRRAFVARGGQYLIARLVAGVFVHGDALQGFFSCLPALWR